MLHILKMQITDMEDNLLADTILTSFEKDTAIARIEKFAENKNKSNSKKKALGIDYEDGEDSLNLGRFVIIKILDNIRGVTTYRGFITYRLRYLVHIESLQLISSVQRRKDVKVNLEHETSIFPIVLTQIGSSTAIARKADEAKFVSLLDISAGGIGFSTPFELDKDSLYQLDFDLGTKPITLTFKIIRSIKKTEDDFFIYGCSFENLTLKEEEIIRQFVFKYLALNRASANQ